MNIHQEDLSKHSNYKIGPSVKYFTQVKTKDEILEAIEYAKKNSLKIFVLGGATNILFTKDNYDSFLFIKNEVIDTIEISQHIWEIGAGVLVSPFVKTLCEKGLDGLAWAGGLPGTFGGAIRGNAGAFKGEMKDSVVEVSSINLATKEVLVRSNIECKFGYRDSIFKHSASDEIIVSGKFSFSKTDSSQLVSAYNEKVDYRTKNHPMEYPSLGSTFKNTPFDMFSDQMKEIVKGVMKTDPFPVIPTAYLIDQCGLKGYRVGGIEISTKQPNFLVNIDNGRAEDVLQIIEVVKKRVFEKFGVNLNEEIQIY